MKAHLSGLLSKVFIGACNDLMVDALVLTLMIDRHVAKSAQAQLTNLLVVVIKNISSVLIVEELSELRNSSCSQKRLNTEITEGQISEGLEQVDEVLGVLVFHGVFI